MYEKVALPTEVSVISNQKTFNWLLFPFTYIYFLILNFMTVQLCCVPIKLNVNQYVNKLQV